MDPERGASPAAATTAATLAALSWDEIDDDTPIAALKRVKAAATDHEPLAVLPTAAGRMPATAPPSGLFPNIKSNIKSGAKRPAPLTLGRHSVDASGRRKASKYFAANATSSGNVTRDTGKAGPACGHKWLQNLELLRPCIKADGTMDYSALDGEARTRLRNFVREQRRAYRNRENQTPTPTARERFRLLAEAGVDLAPRPAVVPRPADAHSRPSATSNDLTTPTKTKSPAMTQAVDGDPSPSTEEKTHMQKSLVEIVDAVLADTLGDMASKRAFFAKVVEAKNDYDEKANTAEEGGGQEKSFAC